MADMSAKLMEEGKATRIREETFTADPYPAGSQDSPDWIEGHAYDLAEQNG